MEIGHFLLKNITAIARQRVVIDTGADVSVAPMWFEKCGQHQQDWCGAQIRNANGDEMITRGIRRMSLSMYDVQGANFSCWELDGDWDRSLVMGCAWYVLQEPPSFFGAVFWCVAVRRSAGDGGSRPRPDSLSFFFSFFSRQE